MHIAAGTESDNGIVPTGQPVENIRAQPEPPSVAGRIKDQDAIGLGLRRLGELQLERMPVEHHPRLRLDLRPGIRQIQMA